MNKCYEIAYQAIVEAFKIALSKREAWSRKPHCCSHCEKSDRLEKPASQKVPTKGSRKRKNWSADMVTPLNCLR